MHVDLMRRADAAFPKLEPSDEITSLRIWHCKYKSLKALAELRHLEELVIASFPDKSLQVLRPLTKLRLLSVLHLPKVSELSVLAELTDIESLSLATSPSWDAAGKCTYVESLEPIAGMASLKHLELFGVCAVDKSLAPLEKCRNLQTARFSQYPRQEVERFYRVTNVANRSNPKPSFES